MDYICVAKPKEVFNVYGESIGKTNTRFLCYDKTIGRNRIYRQDVYGMLQYKNLKILKYKSNKYAQKICDLINDEYGDEFEVKEE